ncbi:hypothetical protein GCM10022251_68500 [Phytohabitans flavus]|uniref:DUF4276 family protein n=1 Tax=Phytohabitans flavus TaxID=1076124 RepID=A0A6F8XQZ7_9ACTN|nr:hypothetical protein [Phytohabitans flavus]BCB76178.1 hypothetical protein Pflav_025880 [Phytohabitans flavus]
MAEGSRKPGERIVILGEDDNDRKTLKVLIAALRPDLPAGSLRDLREPITLVKGVPPERLPTKATKVSAVLRAYNRREPIRCVFMHEDADDFDPAHVPLIEKIEKTYRSLPWPVHAVVPAWEMETWWFLFPTAVASLHRSWRAPDQYLGKDVGRVRDAKERLRQCVRPAGNRSTAFRSYAESDSVHIAKKVVELGLLTPPWAARSASWLAFLEKVEAA